MVEDTTVLHVQGRTVARDNKTSALRSERPCLTRSGHQCRQRLHEEDMGLLVGVVDMLKEVQCLQEAVSTREVHHPHHMAGVAMVLGVVEVIQALLRHQV